jgi:hypothetical protein
MHASVAVLTMASSACSDRTEMVIPDRAIARRNDPEILALDFRRGVHELELMLLQPLDTPLREKLREQLVVLLARLDADQSVSDQAYLRMIQDRLEALWVMRGGAIEGDPALYAAMEQWAEAERVRLRAEADRVRRRLGRIF